MSLVPLAQRIESARFWRRYESVAREAHIASGSGSDPLRILVWPFRAAHTVTPVELLLGNALRMRGHDVRVAFCQGAFTACDNFTVQDNAARACLRCSTNARQALEASGLQGVAIPHQPDERQSRLADELRTREILEYEEDGIDLGNIVRGSVLRYLLKASIDPEADDPVIRRYFRDALGILQLARETFDQFDPQRLLVSHGIYVSWGIVTELAKRRGVPVVVWGQGYRRRSVLFVHGDSYHSVLRDDSGERWRGIPLSPEDRKRTVEYLHSRRRGDQDDISYNRDPDERTSVIRRNLGIQEGVPTFVLFTNLVWDAAVVSGRDRAFDDMLDWVIRTVELFSERPEWQLIIRVHPAEVKGQNVTREKVADVLQQRYGALPANIRVIPPDDPTSSYVLTELADVGMVYSSKIGLEIATMGKPVVVAGDAFYRNKGFTWDVHDRAHHGTVLETALARGMDGARVEEAIRCAHHYFFVQHFDFEVAGLRPQPKTPVARWVDRLVHGTYEINIDGPEELASAEPIRRICQGIERLEPFDAP
jgi:hypothetical protein